MVATPRSVSNAVQQTTIKVSYAVKPVNTKYLDDQSHATMAMTIHTQKRKNFWPHRQYTASRKCTKSNFAVHLCGMLSAGYCQ